MLRRWRRAVQMDKIKGDGAGDVGRCLPPLPIVQKMQSFPVLSVRPPCAHRPRRHGQRCNRWQLRSSGLWLSGWAESGRLG